MINALKLAQALRLMADGLEMSVSAMSEEDSAPTIPATVTRKAEEVEKGKKAEETAAAKAKKAEEEAAAAKSKKAEEEAAAAKVEKAEGEAAPETEQEDGGEVTLSSLQDQAAILLAGGHRRTLKTILDELGLKSLSTAGAESYPELREKLTEAIEGMDLT